MTLYEFSRLSLSDREELIASTAEYICEIHEDDASSFFYALDGFFVEVVLMDGDVEISDAFPFRDGERYEQMLEGLLVEL